MNNCSYLHGRGVEPEEGDEHEDEEDASGELEVLLGLVLAQGGHAGEQAPALHARLGQHQQQGPAQRQVAEQELHVPQDAVRDRLRRRGGERNNFEQVSFQGTTLPPSIKIFEKIRQLCRSQEILDLAKI